MAERSGDLRAYLKSWYGRNIFRLLTAQIIGSGWKSRKIKMKKNLLETSASEKMTNQIEKSTRYEHADV